MQKLLEKVSRQRTNFHWFSVWDLILALQILAFRGIQQQGKEVIPEKSI